MKHRMLKMTLLAIVTFLAPTLTFASGITMVGKDKGISKKDKEAGKGGFNGSLYSFQPLDHWETNSRGQRVMRVRCKDHNGHNDEYYVVNCVFLPKQTRVMILDQPDIDEDDTEFSEPGILFEILQDDMVLSVELPKDDKKKRDVIFHVLGRPERNSEERQSEAVEGKHYRIIQHRKGRLGGKVSWVHAVAPNLNSSDVKMVNELNVRLVKVMEQQLGYTGKEKHESTQLGNRRSRSAGALKWENANGNNYRFHEPHWWKPNRDSVTAIMRFDHDKSVDRDDRYVMAYMFDADTFALKGIYQCAHPSSPASGDVMASMTNVGHGASAVGLAASMSPEPVVSKVVGIAANVTAVIADGISQISDIVSNQADTGGYTAMIDECSARSLVCAEVAHQIANGQRVGYQDRLARDITREMRDHLKAALDNYPEKGGRAFKFNAKEPSPPFLSGEAEEIKALGNHNYRIYEPFVMWAAGEVHVTAKIDHIRGVAKDDYASLRVSVNPYSGDITLYPLVAAGGGKTKIAKNIGSFAMNTAMALIGAKGASPGSAVTKTAGGVAAKSSKLAKLGNMKVMSGKLVFKKAATKVKVGADDVTDITVGNVAENIVGGAVDWAYGTYAGSHVNNFFLDSLPEDRKHFGEVVQALQRRLGSICIETLKDNPTVAAMIDRQLNEGLANPWSGEWTDSDGKLYTVMVFGSRIVVAGDAEWSPATGDILSTRNGTSIAQISFRNKTSDETRTASTELKFNTSDPDYLPTISTSSPMKLDLGKKGVARGFSVGSELTISVKAPGCRIGSIGRPRNMLVPRNNSIGKTLTSSRTPLTMHAIVPDSPRVYRVNRFAWLGNKPRGFSHLDGMSIDEAARTASPDSASSVLNSDGAHMELNLTLPSRQEKILTFKLDRGTGTPRTILFGLEGPKTPALDISGKPVASVTWTFEDKTRIEWKLKVTSTYSSSSRKWNVNVDLEREAAPTIASGSVSARWKRAGDRRFTEIAIAPNGTAYAIYRDDVYQWTGSTWNELYDPEAPFMAVCGRNGGVYFLEKDAEGKGYLFESPRRTYLRMRDADSAKPRSLGKPRDLFADANGDLLAVLDESSDKPPIHIRKMTLDSSGSGSWNTLFTINEDVGITRLANRTSSYGRSRISIIYRGSDKGKLLIAPDPDGRSTLVNLKSQDIDLASNESLWVVTEDSRLLRYRHAFPPDISTASRTSRRKVWQERLPDMSRLTGTRLEQALGANWELMSYKVKKIACDRTKGGAPWLIDADGYVYQPNFTADAPKR